jgi:hypothetical protein
MDNTELDFGIRVNAVYCFRESRQAIHAGDQNIIHATVLRSVSTDSQKLAP